jgi:predicted amidohydrolase
MPRKVKIATTALATLEDTAPPFNLRYPEPADNLRLGLAMLEAAGRQNADIAILPEGFLAAGLPARRLRSVAEPLSGSSMTVIADCARRHSMYVVAGLHVLEDGLLFNIAVLIDRSGKIIGKYAKKHPTEGEIECGVIPGGVVPVFETDFGRLGLSICFDVNWPSLWDELKKRGAELVCWLSAYEGGLPLQAYAWRHRFVIATSVWPYHARVIEQTGRIVAQTSRWSRLVICDIDLDKRLFHTDDQAKHILPIQTRYGDRIRIETFTEEHLFTLESTDPALNVEEVVQEFGLVDYQTYVDRCTRAQQAARAAIDVLESGLHI